MSVKPKSAGNKAYRDAVWMKDKCHFEVEGHYFPNLSAVFGVAVSKGFVGSRAAIVGRLQRGARTWKEICAPMDQKRSEASISGKKSKKDRDREEMARVLAAIDERKRQIAKDQLMKYGVDRSIDEEDD